MVREQVRLRQPENEKQLNPKSGLTRLAHLHAASDVLRRGKLGGEPLGSLKLGGLHRGLGLLGRLAGGHVLPTRGKVGIFRLREVGA